MAEHDPADFAELIEAEPSKPSAAEIGEWVSVYTRLIDMLEHQLAETERFAESVPEAVRTYLSTDNVKILTEEMVFFRGRLAEWRSLADAGVSPAPGPPPPG